MRSLTQTELAVLGAVHRADEEEGGLDVATLEPEEREALGALASLGLVEVGTDEDREDAGGGGAFARISYSGVEVLRDAGMR
jgi:hypothetical protein